MINAEDRHRHPAEQVYVCMRADRCVVVGASHFQAEHDTGGEETDRRHEVEARYSWHGPLHKIFSDGNMFFDTCQYRAGGEPAVSGPAGCYPARP